MAAESVPAGDPACAGAPTEPVEVCLAEAGEIRCALERIERIERMVETLVRERTRVRAEALSLRQAAKILGIDRSSTLPALIAAGIIHTVNIGGHVRISRPELDRVLAEGASLDSVKRRRRPSPARVRSNEEEAAAIARLRVTR